MSLVEDIWEKITHINQAPRASPLPSSPTRRANPGSGSGLKAAPTVDVEAALAQAAATRKGGGGNWRTSVVDLLKLLELDSSLAARKRLAAELGVKAGEPGSAEQNIALSRAVWAKLAEHGGHVPTSLRD